jgi:hypothetical protein
MKYRIIKHNSTPPLYVVQCRECGWWPFWENIKERSGTVFPSYYVMHHSTPEDAESYAQQHSKKHTNDHNFKKRTVEKVMNLP